MDRLWLVARSLKNEGGKYDYKIQKFDAIKLGRVRFRVKDFKCDKISMSETELYNQELKEAQEVKGVKDFQSFSCSISAVGRFKITDRQREPTRSSLNAKRR